MKIELLKLDKIDKNWWFVFPSDFVEPLIVIFFLSSTIGATTKEQIQSNLFCYHHSIPQQKQKRNPTIFSLKKNKSIDNIFSANLT